MNRSFQVVAYLCGDYSRPVGSSQECAGKVGMPGTLRHGPDRAARGLRREGDTRSVRHTQAPTHPHTHTPTPTHTRIQGAYLHWLAPGLACREDSPALFAAEHGRSNGGQSSAVCCLAAAAVVVPQPDCLLLQRYSTISPLRGVSRASRSYLDGQIGLPSIPRRFRLPSIPRRFRLPSIPHRFRLPSIPHRFRSASQSPSVPVAEDGRYMHGAPRPR